MGRYIEMSILVTQTNVVRLSRRCAGRRGKPGMANRWIADHGTTSAQNLGQLMETNPIYGEVGGVVGLKLLSIAVDKSPPFVTSMVTAWLRQNQTEGVAWKEAIGN